MSPAHRSSASRSDRAPGRAPPRSRTSLRAPARAHQPASSTPSPAPRSNTRAASRSTRAANADRDRHQPRPGEVGRLLRDLRETSGMTQDGLARASGCSKAYLSLVESGRRSLSEPRARAIEVALDVHDERLQEALRWQRVPPAIREQMEDGAARQLALAQQLKAALASRAPLKNLREIVEQSSSSLSSSSSSGDQSADADSADAPGLHVLPLPLSSMALRRNIPIINRVAAGYPREFTDLDYPRSVADEYLSCPDVSDPDAFAARVVGDSMEPEYHEGDIVVFSPQAALARGSAAGPHEGVDCFVRLERDAETTFKRVYFEGRGRSQMIRLQPLNSSYPPRVVRREEVAGLYAAVYVLRKIRPGAM